MQPGTVLAHYRVEERIGKGGMGEVFRAHDTVLDRDVALKILSPAFATDANRLARFQREAKVLASLNHPNIAAVYGFEHTPDCTFLVMELVEGEDLSTILARGALSVDEAVAISLQIATGLEEAHEHGITHRDLKPANVKRAPDGRVKVLDFGLAKVLTGHAAVEGPISSGLTPTVAMTDAGTIVGTAAYMSPEQARGKEVDRRTDIWAFGAILFEMLTGRRPFAGETTSDTLASILKSEPDWHSLPDGLPHQVECVLHRCLSKDPLTRLRDIGEAKVRLENPEAESGVFSGAITAAEGKVSLSRRLLPWGLLAACLAAAAWLALGRIWGPATVPSLHLALPSPESCEFMVDGSSPGLPVVSPDGRSVVFSARSEADNSVQLYVRALGAEKSVALDGTGNAQYPFWSPDGQWVGFYDGNGNLKKIPVGGGPYQTVCKASNGKGASWGKLGQILFTSDFSAPISVVAAVGGEPREVTSLKDDEGFDSHRHPQFLPDGHHFLYLARRADGRDAELRLADLDGGPAKVVMMVPVAARFTSGHLLFVTEQTLMAQPFDPGKGELSGAPVPVASDVLLIPGAALAAFSASDEGTLVYLRSKINSDATLVWLDRKGDEIGQLGDRAQYGTVVLSPDNRRAAVTIRDPVSDTHDIWIYEIERNFRTRFTHGPADENYPVWQPDGRALLFASDHGGRYAIYRKELGGTGEGELVFDLDTPVVIWDYADNGHTVVYSTVGEDGSLDLWSINLSGGKEPRLLRRTPGDEGAAKLSPDGRWIAFWSDESGTGQVYLAPWPEMSPISQVTTTTGTWHFWRGDSRELICQEETGRIQSYTLEPDGGTMHIGVQVHLFDFTMPSKEGAWLDLAATGERFLVLNSDAIKAPAYCEVVTDWLSRIP